MIKLRQECGWLTFAVTQLSYILRMKVVSEFVCYQTDIL